MGATGVKTEWNRARKMTENPEKKKTLAKFEEEKAKSDKMGVTGVKTEWDETQKMTENSEKNERWPNLKSESRKWKKWCDRSEDRAG